MLVAFKITTTDSEDELCGGYCLTEGQASSVYLSKWKVPCQQDADCGSYSDCSGNTTNGKILKCENNICTPHKCW